MARSVGVGLKIFQLQKSGSLDLQRWGEKRKIFPPEREAGFINMSHVNKQFSLI